MDTAWMVRQDGYKIPVTVHIYGAMEEGKVLNDSWSLEENVLAAIFVYKYSKDKFSKNLASEVISKWAIIMLGSYLDQGIINEEDLKNFRDINLLGEIPPFYSKLITLRELWDLVPKGWIVDLEENYEKFDGYSGSEINEVLNQEFMRARYGGEYDSSSGNYDIYFRISSTGFEWNKVIDKFLSEFKRKVTSITIEKDFESTGTDNVYKTSKGTPINRLPIDSYWTEDEGKLPLFESKEQRNIGRVGPRVHLRESLRNGVTFTEYLSKISPERMREEATRLFEMIKHRELVTKTVKKPATY